MKTVCIAPGNCLIYYMTKPSHCNYRRLELVLASMSPEYTSIVTIACCVEMKWTRAPALGPGSLCEVPLMMSEQFGGSVLALMKIW